MFLILPELPKVKQEEKTSGEEYQTQTINAGGCCSYDEEVRTYCTPAVFQKRLLIKSYLRIIQKPSFCILTNILLLI